MICKNCNRAIHFSITDPTQYIHNQTGSCYCDSVKSKGEKAEPLIENEETTGLVDED